MYMLKLKLVRNQCTYTVYCVPVCLTQGYMSIHGSAYQIIK